MSPENENMEENENGDRDEVEEIANASSSSDSFLDNGSDDNKDEGDDASHPEEVLTEEEIEELINELIEAESKAAEAQESLEEESLEKVEAEVREELGQTLGGDELEKAVAEEMETFKEEWEAILDELETETAHLLEQLDGAGVELPTVYKWIESQIPHGCRTEAWKKKTHWVGSQVTIDATESITDAEKYLQIQRPVRRRHGKILEDGASGFLGRKFSSSGGCEPTSNNQDIDWCSFSKICCDKSSLGGISFGSKDWASVYLASTPQQAAELGLKFPGVDEVEEIDDIEGISVDPFFADAIANEGDVKLTEEQRRNFKKVKEEDDIDADRKLQIRLKRRRRRKKCREDAFENQEFSTVHGLSYIHHTLKEKTLSNGVLTDDNGVAASQDLKDGPHESSNNVDMIVEGPKCNGNSLMVAQSASHNIIDSSDSKRLDGYDELDGDYENLVNRGGLSSPKYNVSKMGDQFDLQNDADNGICSNSPCLMSRNKYFRCTACDKLSWEVQIHPLLKVVVCLDCKRLIESKMQVKDVDCSECYCSWCGQNSDLRSCRSCRNFFCTRCIKRNLGEKLLLQVQTSSWQCCFCIPSMLQPFTAPLEDAIESGGLQDSSSDSESDNSDADINTAISTKRRRKKKIRRILDDAELGEETKKKIAIEKERQERLKSLGAQFSMKSSMISSAKSNWNISEGGGVQVLGDQLTGYIVNVVRDVGEEPVRIPPSISAKLKPHQITGVRFMWENIIQSVRKVKSGDKGLGCILAHTMGLGKTFQVIAFLYAAMRSVDLGLRTVLIVTPVSVLHNWRNEFTKWRPSELKPLRVFMLEDVPRERRAEFLVKWRSKGGVFLIGYTAFRNLSLGKHIKDRDMAREISCALQDGPDILVCDEAHMIKNTRADITQALKQVKCQRRIALTGSPLQNNLMEYYCMVDFVREGFLGSSHEFRNRFQNPIENGQHTNSTANDVKIMNQRSHILYEQLKGFVQRMDMNVVKNDLPPKTVFVISVKLSPLQRKLYKKFLDVHGFTKNKVSAEKIRKRCFFTGYQALAQIWNHPGILQLVKENKDPGRREDAVENFLVDDSSSDENMDYNVTPGEKLESRFEFEDRKTDSGYLYEDWWRDLLHDSNYEEADYSGKMVLLLDILKMCSNWGDKALVFSQSLLTLDLIELYLSKLLRPGKVGKYWRRGRDWFRLDGRTEGSERQKMVDNFNDPSNRRVKCALISTKAGSLGINLHAANRVIIVDGSWNPTYDLQAIYRVWRYGQTKPVFAYRLLAHGTMEEKIYKRQVTKEGLAARVVDRQQVHRTISKEEMLHLFDFGDDERPDTLPNMREESEDKADLNMSSDLGHFQKPKVPFPRGSITSDELMEQLIARHHPSWIANYHEHETLLQENEDEKLSKEEEEMAWEVYRRTFEWTEVQRILPDESTFQQHQPTDNSENVQQQIPAKGSESGQNPLLPQNTDSLSEGPGPEPELKAVLPQPSYQRSRFRPRITPRKCTNLSHMLTLRSQGIKPGCSTVCGGCGQEITREDVNKTAGM